LSPLPQALAAHPELDRWVRVDADSTITVFTGKVELGQGLLGALARIAADELDVALARVRVRTADTLHGLDERFTAGSLSMMDSGTALRQASCEVRALLLELAAERLGVAIERLEVADGTISDAAGAASVSYWELTGGRPLRRLASGAVKPKAAQARAHRRHHAFRRGSAQRRHGAWPRRAPAQSDGNAAEPRGRPRARARGRHRGRAPRQFRRRARRARGAGGSCC